MNRDEQKAITAFIEGAVNAPLPEMDIEADAIIRALFVRNPEAAYRVTMLAMARARETEAVSMPVTRKSWLARVLKIWPLQRPRLEPAGGRAARY